MVVGFTSTYAIGAYHHWCCEFEFRSWSGVQHYVIKFVGDLRQVGVFLRVVWFPPPKHWPPRHNWNIVGSGVKHHKAKPEIILMLIILPTEFTIYKKINLC